MKIKRYAICLCLVMFAGIILYSQQEVVISIKDGMPAIPLALPEFITQSPSPEIRAFGKELHQIIAGDLDYSRVFQLLPKSYYSYIRPLNPKNIFFKDWQSIQATLLLVGILSESEQKDFLFEGKIYDVKSGRFIFGKRYQSAKSLLRLVAHKMADEIMKIYGERPIFTSKIVFISDRDGNDELYMMDYDGHNQTRLTFNKIIDYMPAWTTEGEKIAYTSYRGTEAGLYIYNPYEGTRKEVMSTGTNYAPSFSPDGKKLAFCSTIEEGNSEIYVANSDGTDIRRITFNNAIDTSPAWSPNSREIAFTSDRGGTPQIYIMDAEGSNVRRVSFGGSYHDAPAWSPTGDRIIYVSRVDQIFDLYVLNLRTNKIIKLTESTARNESPCWSPDGRHIIFSSNLNGTIQLYTIDYDGRNLKRLTSRGNNKLPDWSR
ncbi:MAG: Tol-Pal system beta propeller repeat protein TolB [Candidatus Aminicenantes bacterium]|nr:Tol-Pal system beta propeller repeat protein TolB [Candidatus Aminicenantes bacterium]MDH5704571.1 Tol-Pal system beta propeller repeat protein TolB [Candidatus Aminicenantes bacterium]